MERVAHRGRSLTDPVTVRFSRVDRSVVSVADTFADLDEKAFWLARTPAERLEALEMYRVITFGYDPSTARLQRVLESTDFPLR